MINTDIIRTSHTVLTFNFTKKTASFINEHDDGAIRKIHIFVFNPNRVDTKALSVFSEEARRRCLEGTKQLIILHVFSKKDRSILRKRLKGVPKGRWFHFNLVSDRGMKFALSPDRSVRIKDHEVIEMVRKQDCTWKEKLYIRYTEDNA